MNDYKKITGVSLSSKLIEELDRLATQDNRSRSGMIEHIVRNYLHENEDEFKVKHKD